MDLRQAFAQAVVAPSCRADHPPTPRIRGEARLYAVWKCFALVNLAIARRCRRSGEDTCRRAGQRECLRIAIHLIRYTLIDGERAHLLEQHARTAARRNLYAHHARVPTMPVPTACRCSWHGVRAQAAEACTRQADDAPLHARPGDLQPASAILDLLRAASRRCSRPESPQPSLGQPGVAASHLGR